MLKTLLILPDGTEITSGTSYEPAVFSAKLTQCVNDSQELMLGSVCANMLELQILDPENSLQLQENEEIRLFRLEEDGTRYPLGPFCLEKPERTSAHMLRITAYDRITRLDQDLSQWLAGLEEWPYPLLTFGQMVCEACGLTLVNDSIPNGDYPVQAFAAQGITGRKLMQWVGEAAGRFCRATAEGNVELAWFTPADITLSPDGDRFYFQGSLSYADYQVAPIEKVQLRLTQDDVGVVWPDAAGEKNTYIITGNYLLTTTDTDTLLPVAKTLHEGLKDITYTPCKVKLPAGMDIRAGHLLDITDRSGKTVTAYVMTKIQSGQLDTLECTGSRRRDSTTALNNEDYRAKNGKLLEISKKAEGLSVRVSSVETDVNAVRDSMAEVQVQADGLHLRVLQSEENIGQALESINDSVAALQKEVSAKVSTEALELQIRSAMENGIDKVVTSTGFTFDDAGMTVEKSGSEMKTTISENGMAVSQNGQEVLTAGNKGVDAKNLHATTYLIVGGRSRFENYGADRTGCFWIGG